MFYFQNGKDAVQAGEKLCVVYSEETEIGETKAGEMHPILVAQSLKMTIKWGR